MLGSKHVSDEALLKANDTIRKMFAYRHDILKAMIADGARLVVLGRKEKLSDLPEFKDARNEAGLDDVRYLDYTPAIKLMVVPEENVLGLAERPVRRASAWWSSVFAKGLYRVDGVAAGRSRIRQAARQAAVRAARASGWTSSSTRSCTKIFDAATEKELWKGTRGGPRPGRVLGRGRGGVLRRRRHRHCRRTAPTGPIATREALKAYDPDLFALVDETMAFRERVDWRIKR